jgi:glycosyltransferase involved in cell wall biosynthesis
MARRVVFLITDLDLGGGPLVVRRIGRGLRQAGQWRPTVVSLKPSGVVGTLLRHDDVEVVSLQARHPADAGVGYRWLRLLNRIRPEVVVSVLFHANALAAAAAPLGPPCVYLQSVHTLQPTPRWHWVLQGLLAGRGEGVIAPSRAILRHLETYGSFAAGYVVPNGVDVETLARAAPIPPEKRPWPPGARVVGCVGRFDPVKQIDRLVRAMAWLWRGDYARHQAVYLALIGYGPAERQLRALARELGCASHVALPGPTLTPEHWYKCIDVLCVPSRVEGFGLTLIEAMAAGVPVLAFSGGATAEIVEHGVTGYLVDFQRPHALAEGLEILLGDSALRRRLAEAGQRTARQRFSSEQMVAGYTNILNSF